MTPEEKEAAIKEALKKRAIGTQQKGKTEALVGAKLEKQERKAKAKKSKAEDRDR